VTPLKFEGGCHCGNLTYVFEASSPLDRLGLRACQCRFCREHGARNTSDPQGHIGIAVRDPENLRRYRFALKTADFLICSECGVFIGAVMADGDATWMTVNVNTFTDPPALNHPIVRMNFDGEDAQARRNRRKARWTPVAEFQEVPAKVA
jgi:hypothetical protein